MHISYLKKEIILNILFFLVISLLFYFYLFTNLPNLFFLKLGAILIPLIILILTALKAKVGLYAFIFIFPLLNSLPVILGAGRFTPALFLFFGLFMGYILNRIIGLIKKINLSIYSINTFSNYYFSTIVAYIVFLTFSAIVTVIRYANFYPFITSKFYNLNININAFKANYAINWTIEHYFNYAILFLLIVLIFYTTRNTKDIIISNIVLISSITISSFFIIYQKFFNPYLGNYKHWVISSSFNSTFYDPNSLGISVVLLLPIFLIMIFNFRKKYINFIFFISFLFFLLLVFYSGSKSAIIGFIVAMIIFTVIGLKIIFKKLYKLNKKKKISLLIITITVIIIIIFSAVFFILSNNYSSIDTMQRTSETINTFISFYNRLGLVEALKSVSNYRYLLWERAWQMFRDYPLSGVGSGSYYMELPDYNWRYDRGFLQVDYAGNYFLQILAELGLFGIIFNVLLYIYIIIKYFSYYKNIKANKIKDENIFILHSFFISFSSIMLIFIFHPPFVIEIQLFFGLILGLMLSYIRNKSIKYGFYNKNIEKQKNINLKLTKNFNNFIIFIKKNALKLVYSIFIIIFIFSFVLSSIRSLSINYKQVEFNWSDKGWENNYGFYKEETIGNETFRWTSIDASEVVEKNGTKMIIPMKDTIPIEPEKPLSVKIFVDNILVKKVNIKHNIWTDVEIDMPDFDRDRFTLTLAFSRSWIPRELDLNPDTRELGIRIGEYRFID